MPLRVNNNIPALNVRRVLGINNRDLKLRIERLSSGLRINRAADDAAGLSVSESMRAELNGLRQSVRNAEQATNLIQTGEGALNEVNAILIRMRELAVQSASSTLNDENREATNAEFGQLITEIDRIGEVTAYNNVNLLTGYGNTVSQSGSTSLTASNNTGIVGVQISGAASGSYTFVDAGTTDNQITLGNGTVTQTIDIAPSLDHHSCHRRVSRRRSEHEQHAGDRKRHWRYIPGGAGQRSRSSDGDQHPGYEGYGNDSEPFRRRSQHALRRADGHHLHRPGHHRSRPATWRFGCVPEPAGVQHRREREHD